VLVPRTVESRAVDVQRVRWQGAPDRRRQIVVSLVRHRRPSSQVEVADVGERLASLIHVKVSALDSSLLALWTRNRRSGRAGE
jgi:hypothetical protein